MELFCIGEYITFAPIPNNFSERHTNSNRPCEDKQNSRSTTLSDFIFERKNKQCFKWVVNIHFTTVYHFFKQTSTKKNSTSLFLLDIIISSSLATNKIYEHTHISEKYESVCMDSIHY